MKARIRTLYFLFLVLPCALAAKPSEQESDSLVQVLKTARTQEKGPILISICNGYYDSQPEKAKEYARKLIELGEKTGNQSWIIKGHYGLAMADYYHSNLTEAYTSFEQSYRLSEKAGNDSTATLALNSMAVIRARLGHFDQARALFRKIGSLAVKTKQHQSFVTSLMNLGNCFYEESNTDSALFYYREGYRLAQKLDLVLSAVTFGINMADLEKERENYGMAWQYIREALVLARRSNNTEQVLTCLTSLSGIELKRKRFNEAEWYAREALKLATSTGAKDEIMASYYALYQLKDQQNRPSEALSYFRQYTTMKDSILNEDVQSHILELSARYENEKKEKTILAQEKDLQRAHQRIFFLVVLATLLLLMFLLGLGFYRKRSQMLRQLLEKNLEAMEAECSAGGAVCMNDLQDSRNSEKYRNSTLSPSSKEYLEVELNKLFEEQKPWRQGDISLEKIAHQLDTNTKYLSQIINQKYRQSFPNFINELRVKDARCMLIDPYYAHYTIDAIGRMTGFNSNTSFVNAFKRYTGLTPSYFRNSRRETA